LSCFWELWDVAVHSNETWSFNGDTWSLRWLLNHLFDLNNCFRWWLFLYRHFTSHCGTGWRNIFLIMNCILCFVLFDNLFVLNFHKHHSKIGQLLSLLTCFVVLVYYLSCSAQIHWSSWWDIGRMIGRYTRRTVIGKVVLVFNLNSHGFFKGG